MNRAAIQRHLLRLAVGAWALAALLFASGCASFSGNRAAVKPTRTEAVPARLVGHLFFVELPQSDGRVHRFLVDTGSTLSYVTPAAAKTLALRDRTPRTVDVQAPGGTTRTLPAVTLRRLQVGGVTFENVPAALHDFTALSERLGFTVDGLLAFPLFRDHLLTLDYPGRRLVLAPQPDTAEPILRLDPRASTLAFSNEQRVPFVPVQMGNESFSVLIDSGSDGALTLNPAGLHPRFTFGPRVGATVVTLAGEHEQLVGRLRQDLLLGGHTLTTPVADLTTGVSSLGGEILRHFVITFDQRRNFVTFARDTDGAVGAEPRRSTGLALARAPAYWRVVGIVPDTPTSRLGVQPGEVVVRVNGEPVTAWTFERFSELVANAVQVTLTFLAGTREFDREVPVFDLVP